MKTINTLIDAFNENRYVKLFSTIGVSILVLWEWIVKLIQDIKNVNLGIEVPQGQIMSTVIAMIPDVLLLLVILALLFSVAYVRKENKRIRGIVIAIHLLENIRWVHSGVHFTDGEERNRLIKWMRENNDINGIYSEAEIIDIVDSFYKGKRKFEDVK